MADKGFGGRVVSLRGQHGWTQDELAKRVGVSRAAVQNWEAGTRPRGAMLERIAIVFGVSTSVLLDGDADARVLVVREPSPTPAQMPKSLREFAHRLEKEAHKLGATAEDMDYIRASIADPDTMVNLLSDTELDRPLTAEEQEEELEDLREELLAWLKRRVERRDARRRRGE